MQNAVGNPHVFLVFGFLLLHSHQPLFSPPRRDASLPDKGVDLMHELLVTRQPPPRRLAHAQNLGAHVVHEAQHRERLEVAQEHQPVGEVGVIQEVLVEAAAVGLHLRS